MVDGSTRIGKERESMRSLHSYTHQTYFRGCSIATGVVVANEVSLDSPHLLDIQKRS